MQERTRKKRAFVREKARELAETLPKSEKWFNSLYLPYSSVDDLRNVPFGGYIPDVINKKLKFIIEVDGSIHNTPKQKARDCKKDKKFNTHGYRVIRIEAYNLNSFHDAMQVVCEIRGPYFKPAITLVSNREIDAAIRKGGKPVKSGS